MQQFIYRIQPTRLAMLAEGPDAREAGIVGQHFAYLQQLCSAGVVLMAGRTLMVDDRTFGLVVFRAESEAAAQQVVDMDPAVRLGVMRAELFPYRIALWSKSGPDDENHGA